jgi:hypothetical protein
MMALPGGAIMRTPHIKEVPIPPKMVSSTFFAEWGLSKARNNFYGNHLQSIHRHSGYDAESFVDRQSW